MNLSIITNGTEKILQISLYGTNRSDKVLNYQNKVFKKFNYPINQIFYPMPGISYGAALDHLTNQIHDKVDYLIYFDIDSIPLKPDYLDIILDKIRDKRTVAGGSFQSNHKRKFDGSFNQISCGPPFCISTKMLKELNFPTMDHCLPRSDTFEEVTAVAQEKGYGVYTWYPSSVIGLTEEEAKEIQCPTLKSALGQGLSFGYGTTYSDIFYHQFFANCSTHVDNFINKCKEILGE